jgi:hypothetical protein
MGLENIGAIQARIAEITGRIAPNGSGGRLGTSSATDASGAAEAAASGGGASFASALSQAQSASLTAGADDGTRNKAGVNPTKWAIDFLTKLGKPITAENIRAMKAWQQAEGTGADFNPLATTQGGFPGSTDYNSVHVQNYKSYEDGLNANLRAINNGRYTNILDALGAGNDAMAVARAIKNSPWGSGGLVEKILSRQQ